MASETQPLSTEQREVAETLFRRLAHYGATSDERLIEELKPFYRHAAEILPESERMDMLVALAKLAEDRKLSANCLMPFLFQDGSPAIISTAALHAVPMWPGIDQEPLFGVHQLICHAKQCIDLGEVSRASALYAGLILLGDRRIINGVGPCWRDLPSDARGDFAKFFGGRPWAAVIDWLVDWLEECEAGEFGAVAGSLARIPRSPDYSGVLELERALPIWSSPDGPGCEVVGTWTFREYALRIRPRLLQVAADEAAPRIMHDVLKHWGITYTERLWDGVAMSRDLSVVHRRDLLPLLPTAAYQQTGLFPAVPLDDADFLSRDGQLLLCWAIFNPNGPTWSALGRLPTEDPGVDVLFYRCLNPFTQESAAVGAIRALDRDDGQITSDLIYTLFQHNELSDSREGGLVLIGGGAPDHIEAPWKNDEFIANIWRFFCESPAVAAQSITFDIETMRAHWGDPWANAAAKRDYAFSLMTPAHWKGEEMLVLPTPDPATPELLAQWWQLITKEEHRAGQWLNFPAAWHGAIDHANPSLAQQAFTFFQLDDFLTRFGCSTFRELATMYTRAQNSRIASECQ